MFLVSLRILIVDVRKRNVLIKTIKFVSRSFVYPSVESLKGVIRHGLGEFAVIRMVHVRRWSRERFKVLKTIYRSHAGEFKRSLMNK